MQNISPRQPGVDVDVKFSLVPELVYCCCSRIKRVEVLLLAFIFDEDITDELLALKFGEKVEGRDTDRLCAVTISRAFILRRPSS